MSTATVFGSSWRAVGALDCCTISLNQPLFSQLNPVTAPSLWVMQYSRTVDSTPHWKGRRNGSSHRAPFIVCGTIPSDNKAAMPLSTVAGCLTKRAVRLSPNKEHLWQAPQEATVGKKALRIPGFPLLGPNCVTSVLLGPQPEGVGTSLDVTQLKTRCSRFPFPDFSFYTLAFQWIKIRFLANIPLDMIGVKL